MLVRGIAVRSRVIEARALNPEEQDDENCLGGPTQARKRHQGYDVTSVAARSSGYCQICQLTASKIFA